MSTDTKVPSAKPRAPKTITRTTIANPETDVIRWQIEGFDRFSPEPMTDDTKGCKSPIFTAAGHQWSLTFRPSYIVDSGTNQTKLCAGLWLMLAPTEVNEVVASVRYVMRGGSITSGHTFTNDIKSTGSNDAKDGRDYVCSYTFAAHGEGGGWGMSLTREVLLPIMERFNHVLQCEAHISIVTPTPVVAPPATQTAGLIRAMRALQADRSTSDVTFKIEKKSLYAHRLILCARSDVFKKMFKSGMSESQKGEIVIDDIPRDVFKQLLLYVYTGACDELNDNEPVLPANATAAVAAVTATPIPTTAAACDEGEDGPKGGPSVKRKAADDDTVPPPSSSSSSSSTTPSTTTSSSSSTADSSVSIKRLRSEVTSLDETSTPAPAKKAEVSSLDDPVDEKDQKEDDDEEESEDGVSAISLLIAAHRYELKGLVDICSGVLMETLDIENAINRFILADRYGAKRLKAAAASFITQNRGNEQIQENLKQVPSSLLIELITGPAPPPAAATATSTTGAIDDEDAGDE